MTETAVKEKALEVASKEATPPTDGEVEVLAKKLMSAPAEQQTIMVEDICEQCPASLIKIAFQIVSIVKTSVTTASKDYQRLCNQCDVALAALSACANNETASPEDKKEACKQMMEIVRMSNEAHSKAATQRTAGIAAGCVLGTGVLAIIGDAIVTAIKNKKS